MKKKENQIPCAKISRNNLEKAEGNMFHFTNGYNRRIAALVRLFICVDRKKVLIKCKYQHLKPEPKNQILENNEF